MLRRTALTLCTLLLTLPVLAVAAPAGAATGAPGDLLATSARASDIPTLSWSRVPEATGYTVQVSSSSAFTSTLWSTTTVNINAVPTIQLPSGELWFRVRANAVSGSSDWASRQFTRAQDAGPTLKAPANGATLHQPSDPVLLSWETSPGAIEYEVEISSGAGFTDPALSRTYKTKTTTLVRPDPQPARPYYWRVRGILASGITTHWSSDRSYVLGPLPAATLVSPSQGQVVDDVALDWNPVPGATSYDVEISGVPDFSTLLHSQLRVLGTRYSPPTTLKNDQYYWRVRARDVSGNPQDGSEVTTWNFRRAWPEQPSLTYPADGSNVGDPFFYQWTPVELASRYRLEVMPNPMGGPLPCVVETTQTTLTPTRVQDCMPRPGGSYTWKVLAFDDPGNVQTDPVSAAAATFNYLPGLVTPAAPADGATVTAPTVSWEPREGAAKYDVVLTHTGNGSTIRGTSHTTSFTPPGKLAAGNYRWSVRAVSDDGRVSVAPSAEDERTFELVAAPTATAGTPEPTLPPATYERFPTLTWEPVAGATSYKVQLRSSSGVTFATLPQSFSYPEGQDGTYSGNLTPGDYVWRVQAFGSTGALLSSSATNGQFTIAPRKAVTGQRIAMVGTEAGNPDTTCTLRVPAVCENVSHNPVLSWDPEENTGGYLVSLSYDRELTNLVSGYPVVVNNNVYTPPAALPDSEAGTPYYWAVRPCATLSPLTGCRELEYPVNAFSKLSVPVEPVSPGVSLVSGSPLPSLPDDITFRWKDYLETNTLSPAPGNGLSSPGRAEARQYRIQVSADRQFATLLDDATVDQRTFTSFTNTYPEGQLYWRVQAIDGSRNALPWSRTWTFDKSSPKPQLIGPSGTSGVKGSEPLRWQSLNYASAYDVEIYRNNDTKPDATNLVDSGTIAQTAASWVDPVEPSATPYTWRVRRVDARNRRGDWSAWKSYLVTADPVVLQSPAPEVFVAPAESLFSWQTVPGAATYRWERRAPSSGATAETITTAATAHAPTTTIPDGTWEWRVVALDTARQQLGASGWRSFTVIGAPQVETPPAIEGTGQVGSVLTSTAPSWSMQGVTSYYQWLRAGSPIAGATSPSHEVTGLDVGRAISLRVTGRRPGYRDTITTSNAITATAGPAPSTATPPSISGTGRVGDVITATPPEWNEDGVVMTHQWLRNGSLISGAAGMTYTVSSSDVDKDISFRTTGRKTGYADATVDSNTIRGLIGRAPVNDQRPVVSGTAKVGELLQTSSGAWTPSTGTTYAYQWLRAGAPIQGATAASYRVQSADAGAALSARVTAKRTGHADGTASSDSVSVSRIASRTSASLADSKIRRSARGKVAIIVSATGISAPTGKVSVLKGRKTIASATLTAAKLGRVTLRLPRLPMGRHMLKVKYAGNQQVTSSTSRAMTLTVRR